MALRFLRVIIPLVLLTWILHPPPACSEIFRGVIGIYSNLSVGKDGVATICRTARKAGLDFVVFTERWEKMSPEKLEVLRKECERQSRKGFWAIPGLDVPIYPYKEALRAFVLAPTMWIEEVPRTFFLLFKAAPALFGSPTPILLRPTESPVDPGMLRFWHGVEIFSHEKGRLIEDATEIYKTLTENGFYFFPISGHRIKGADDLLKIEGSFLTYLVGNSFSKGSIVLNPGNSQIFLSNGPIVERFCLGKGAWWGTASPTGVASVRVYCRVRSEVPLQEVRIYDGERLRWRFFPRRRVFERVLEFVPSKGTRLWLEALDEKGKKALSGSVWIESRPSANIMCADNQNNMLELFNPHILFGIAHVGAHNIRLGVARPSSELVPKGVETGVTHAIWHLSVRHHLGLDWTRFDRISFWLKCDRPGVSLGPRWCNGGKWIQPQTALYVKPKDSQWHRYELDISRLPRNAVEAFWFYIPAPPNYTIWLDEVRLINSRTGESILIDDFEGPMKWTTPGFALLSKEGNAPQGEWALKVEVRAPEDKKFPSNAISLLKPVFLLNTLSSNEVLQFAYKEEGSRTTFTFFRPRVYGFNAWLIEAETQAPKGWKPSANQWLLLGRAIPQSVMPHWRFGPWRKFFYVDGEGNWRIDEVPKRMGIEPLGRRGCIGMFPHRYGSFAFLCADDGQYGFSVSPSGILLYVRPRVKDGTLRNTVVFALDAGERFHKQPEAFKHFWDIYGFDGSPAYGVWALRGKAVPSPFVARVKALGGAAVLKIKVREELFGPLGIVIEGLREGWAAVCLDLRKRLIRAIPVKSGKGYMSISVPPERLLFIGHPLICSDGRAMINLVRLGEEGLTLEIHNPTKEPLEMIVKPSDAFPLDQPFKMVVELKPGESRILSLKISRVIPQTLW